MKIIQHYICQPAMIRDRIKDFRRVPARLLVPNPKNWRLHPDRQRTILQGLLNEIGYADALLVRELPNGTLQLIDGHLRAATTPHQEVPVLVLDLDESEADKLLSTLDPLSALADTDHTMLDHLVSQIETESRAVQEFLQELALPTPDVTDLDAGDYPQAIPVVYQILITCQDEDEQREIFQQLHAQGRTCRLVNL